jgi:APA family basic amino acid/polyamine antiporter
MLGYLTADLMGTPRVLFAFARDGLLPGALGRLHARSKAPHIAIICYALIAMGLAVSGTFAELAVLATLTSAALYVLICAAAWRLARRGVAEAVGLSIQMAADGGGGRDRLHAGRDRPGLAGRDHSGCWR